MHRPMEGLWWPSSYLFRMIEASFPGGPSTSRRLVLGVFSRNVDCKFVERIALGLVSVGGSLRRRTSFEERSASSIRRLWSQSTMKTFAPTLVDERCGAAL